jgi:hypothetical protein
MLTEISAHMKSHQKMMKSNQDLLARLEARIETNREKDQEDLKEMWEEIKSGQAEMRSIVCAMRSELKKTIQREMKAATQPIRPELDETSACNEATETKPNPGMMQSTEEHQEIPKGEAAVMLVGGPRKRRRVCNLAAKRRQKRKERTRGYGGSRKKLISACRKVSSHAKVAWRKRNLLRKIRILDNCEPWKRLTVTGRKTTSHATVAWCSENVVRQDCTRDQAKQGTPKRRKDGESLWKCPECNNGIRDRGLK